MIYKNYIVTGKDVNGDMEMESAAYISYTLRFVYRFLFDNGFSKEKLNAHHIGLQEVNHTLICYENLMFTQQFFVEMKHCIINDKINIKCYFFNSKNQCCAEVTKEVEWFDTIRREVIVTPKKILQHFNLNAKVLF